MATNTTVDTQSSAVQAMATHWPQTDALMGGTQAMRDARTTYLPKEKREKLTAYNNRLKRSYLTPAYADTVKKLGAAPFRTPITITAEERLPEMVRRMLQATDRQGRNFTAFWRMAFTEAIHRGVTHVFPDFPAQGFGVMRDQEIAMDVHPYLVHVSPVDMPGWSMQQLPNGMERLKSFRFREVQTVPDPKNEWGDVQQDVYFVYHLVYEDEARLADGLASEGADEVQLMQMGLRGRVELWRRSSSKDAFTLSEVRPYSYVGNPLITLYVNQDGYMTAIPTFRDLGDLNVAHWQSDSDQNNLLHVARVPTLFRSGVTQQEIDDGITLGAAEGVNAKRPDAKMTWVETEGRSLAAGKDHGLELEARMEMLGMQPRMKRPVKTATGEVRDEVRMQSEVESWVRATEHAAEMSIRNAAHMIRQAEQIPDDFSVDAFNDFSLSLNATRDIQALVTVWQGGGLSTEMLLSELKRRNTLPEGMDVQDELERISRQGPPLAAMGFGATADE